MITKIFTGFAIGIFLMAGTVASSFADPLQDFHDAEGWSTTSAANAAAEHLRVADKPGQEKTIIYTNKNWQNASPLVHKRYLADTLVTAEYLLPGDAVATLLLQGRYAVKLPIKNNNGSDNEWQSLSVKYRAPRFDEARNKIEEALMLEVRINGEVIQKNQIFSEISPESAFDWEGREGPTVLKANNGPVAIRNFNVQAADYSPLSLPVESGGATNEEELLDYVALGAEMFESVGCNVCHSTKADSSAVSTGPNLFGLFKPNPRAREIVESGENHRFTIKADSSYLHSSIRTPAAQIAVIESGNKKGEAYPAIMPPISAKILSDSQIDAIGAYLLTLNEPYHQGPVIKLVEPGEQQAYDPVTDRLQLLVDDRTRIQRGPMEGVSGAAIHVGQPNSVNYTFDPRTLSIVKIWQGGFLDMSGELQNRGGKGLKTGYKSREIELGVTQSLISPLNAQGETIDFSFKNAKFGDSETILASLHSDKDHHQRLAEEDAAFLGYQLNSKERTAAPSFRYRIGNNRVALQTAIAANGDTRVAYNGKLKSPQTFAVNTAVLQDAKISAGQLQQGKWTLPAGTQKATLTAKMNLASQVWHSPVSTFDYRQQPVKITEAEAGLPAGYSIENYYPPKDNYGRDQLFEALGLYLTEDGTIVVATRTAGIWRIVKGEWRLFAEGTFDSLGVVAEDKKGLQLVVGQKPELTRISDTNGDGMADSYDTLFDAHSYHGNYHSYMHGPARGANGAYYININLAHDDRSYKAGGAYMGAIGGYSGWSIRVAPNGEYTLWANGLRSPAGLALGPNGRLWYTENQGEFVSTSKLFVLQKNGFYGHPAGLVDLPGMTPESPEIAWEQVADEVEPALVLFPHNKVANSPGNPAWDTTEGKFGPFGGQMLIGDQTQSNLLRVTTETVDGVEQGAIMPFIDDLESGVMRPLFLPDASLLLGQTGRGWQAKGGHLASLQRIKWDGKTVPAAIRTVQAAKDGFVVHLTQPLSASIGVDQLRPLVAIESWLYRDAPDYGSDELDIRTEAVKSLSISDDRKQVRVELERLDQPVVHPQQTARVYHLVLTGEDLFDIAAPARLDAYYTLYNFAK